MKIGLPAKRRVSASNLSNFYCLVRRETVDEETVVELANQAAAKLRQGIEFHLAVWQTIDSNGVAGDRPYVFRLIARELSRRSAAKARAARERRERTEKLTPKSTLVSKRLPF